MLGRNLADDKKIGLDISGNLSPGGNLHELSNLFSRKLECVNTTQMPQPRTILMQKQAFFKKMKLKKSHNLHDNCQILP